MNGRPPLILALLGMTVVVSGLCVVFAKHESRKLFVELQALQAQRDQLNTEWGQLQLEQSTWATPSRVENIAVSRLGMMIPGPQAVVTVRQ